MKYYFLLFLSFFIVFTPVANAGVVIGGTRLVYNGDKKEASISVNNPDNTPYLIQSWVEMEKSTKEKAPFIITPPLFRLDGGSQNILRVVRTGGNLPENKESLYWLNIKSIPSAPKKDNSLQIAIKTRIKLIYRPAALQGSTPENVANKLRVRKSGNQLIVENPTSYYMNFQYLKVNGKEVKNVTYLAPQSKESYSLPDNAAVRNVTWKIINDFGGIGKEYSAAAF